MTLRWLMVFSPLIVRVLGLHPRQTVLLLGVVLAKALSTDGEASAYLKGAFTHNFELKYDVSMQAEPRNRSWSLIGVTLLGFSRGDSSIEIGLSGANTKSRITPFLATTSPHGSATFKTLQPSCSQGCALELRGDDRTIRAFVNSREVHSWARSQMPITRPYVQINGEVDTVGDRLSAVVRPVQVRANAVSLPAPRCGFTTQGVVVTEVWGRLLYRGARDPKASVAYIDLANGALLSKCPHGS